MERVWLAVAGLSGGVAVGADAAARHLLSGDIHRLDLASTAARYGLYHALALLAAAALARGLRRQARQGAARVWLALAGWCFVAGIVLFSGSLYLLAAGAPPPLARATPVGGMLFIAGWAALFFHALTPRGAE